MVLAWGTLPGGYPKTGPADYVCPPSVGGAAAVGRGLAAGGCIGHPAARARAGCGGRRQGAGRLVVGAGGTHLWRGGRRRRIPPGAGPAAAPSLRRCHGGPSVECLRGEGDGRGDGEWRRGDGKRAAGGSRYRGPLGPVITKVDGWEGLWGWNQGGTRRKQCRTLNWPPEKGGYGTTWQWLKIPYHEV